MKKVLILEDEGMLANLFRSQFHGEPIELVIAATAAAARKLFKREEFDVVVLDGIAPSEPGCHASLVGPTLAKEFRSAGYNGPLIASSSDPQAVDLMLKAGCSHSCEKLRLQELLRELLLLSHVPQP